MAHGHLEKRGETAWRLAVQTDCRRHTRTVHAATRKEAERSLRRFADEVDRAPDDHDMTVPELVDFWIAHNATEWSLTPSGATKSNSLISNELSLL